MNNNSKKLHINPNFIKNLENEMPFSKPMLHINPNFFPNITNNVANTKGNILNTKIYVNPKFVAQNQVPTIRTVGAYAIDNENLHLNVASHYSQTENVSPAISSMPKSRYKLVRNEAVRTNNKALTVAVKQKTTIVINKYKTASIKVLKENFENADNMKSLSACTKNIIHNNMQSKSHVNQYKFVRATDSAMPKSKMVNNKILTHSAKKYLESTDKLKLMSIEKSITLRRKINNNMLLKQKSLKSKRPAIGKLKKNNIPCPLFKKYGKCIRKDYGNCKYIHDKKHVSICKKFLHGLCQDANCLLSHDLTAKKMPTCRFYLKGLCTRDNCPYVHVKLSEKTSICVDFLKGYCEKGDQCLKRHIVTCPRYIVTGKCPMLKCPYPHKVLKPKNLKSSIKLEAANKQGNREANCVENSSNDADAKVNDKRYYIDNAEKEEALPESELIRPSRCKLGTLPSYIKL